MLTVLLGAAAGCAPQAIEVPRGIVIVVVDALRPDFLGTYGAPGGVTPGFDRIAARGATFRDATSAAPWTVPSVSSLLTSRYPSEHGEGAQAAVLATPIPTLAEVFHEAGYRTAAFVESDMPLFHRGFDTFEMPTGGMDDRLRRPDENSAAVTFARAIAWLRGAAGDRFFLLVHTCEVHDYFIGKPYQRDFARRRDPQYGGPFLSWGVRDSQEDLGTQIISALLHAGPGDIEFVRDLYAAGVDAVDRQLVAFDAELARLALTDRTVLVVTSDHGEGFRPDLHRLHHAGRLHDDLLHVPLVIRWPGHVPHTTVAQQAELIDVMPTLLGLAGLNAPAGMRGRRLLVPAHGFRRWAAGSLRFRIPPRPAVAEESTYYVNPTGMRERSSIRQAAFYADRMKLIRAGERRELYDLQRDPAETLDLASERPDEVTALDRRLSRFLPQLGLPGTPPRPEVVQQLRTLGYVH